MADPHREQERRESYRRVRIGVAGIFGVLLLVAVTRFVVDNVRKEAALQLPDLTAATTPSAGNAAAPVQNSEPLADLGVTPAPDATAAPAEPAVPAVPDLEPDPRLQKRMDRDPRQPEP